MSKNDLLLTPIEKGSFESFAKGLVPLLPLIEDPSVSEIMVNNHKSIWIEKNGRMEKTDIEMVPSMIRMGIQFLSSAVGNKDAIAGTSTGIVNAAYSGMRIAAVMQPTAIDGDAICIRKHSKTNRTPAQYIANGSFDIEMIAQDKRYVHEQIKPRENLQNEELVNFID
ncbi:Flp pilus assembly CpaF family ATPase [Undibacterium sp. GrIS 1.8]|uniref:hypothetical protein n=1 Tax=Undibacterium sp. GrIS 1.8 TaxID=3143934 RepID=UPI0033997F9E